MARLIADTARHTADINRHTADINRRTADMARADALRVESQSVIGRETAALRADVIQLEVQLLHFGQD